MLIMKIPTMGIFILAIRMIMLNAVTFSNHLLRCTMYYG